MWRTGKLDGSFTIVEGSKPSETGRIGEEFCDPQTVCSNDMERLTDSRVSELED